MMYDDDDDVLTTSSAKVKSVSNISFNFSEC